MDGLRSRPVWLLVALLAATAGGCAGSGPGLVPPDAPYVATPEAVADAMLRLAGVGPGDVVYDLGSGDGRLVLGAARDHGARGVGVEIDPVLVHASQESARRAGLADRVRFLWQDLFAIPLGDATVVTLYLGREVNLRLRPKLLAELAPGARVVSHDFTMGDWRPDRVVRLRGPEREHHLLLWIVPARVEGRWTIQVAGDHGRLELRQRFQELDGTLTVAGSRQPVEGRVAGTGLELTAGPRSLRGRLVEGELSGDATGFSSRMVRWRARPERG